MTPRSMMGAGLKIHIVLVEIKVEGRKGIV